MALPAGDPLWYYKALGLHCDGANNSTTFTDVKGKTVTANGNAKISTAQYPALTGKTSSGLLDGTGDYLSIPDSSDFAFSANDFSIKARIYLGSGWAAQGAILSHRANNSLLPPIFISVTAAKYLRLITASGTGTSLFDKTGTTLLSTSTWYEICVTRSGSSFRAFIDGVVEFTETNSGTLFDTSDILVIGGDTNTNYFNGHISEVEIYKGVALHTANFTPSSGPFLDTYVRISGTTKDSSGTLAPHVVRVMRCSDNSEAGDVISNPSTGEYAVTALDTSPHYVVCHSDLFDTNWSSTSLLLHMNDTGLTDEKGRSITLNGGAARSATQSKFGGYSAYFDGTGDYLSVTGESLGTGDFTVEGWVYPTAAASAHLVFDTRTSDNDSTGFAFYLRATGKLAFIYGNGVVVEGVTTYSANTWYHIAAVRISGVIKLYLNGITEASFSQGNTYSNTGWKIGHQWSVAGTLGAFYLDELRVTKVGRYTAPFTPYEAEFPHGYTGTENALIYDNITPY